jgi:hypothetical protein
MTKQSITIPPEVAAIIPYSQLEVTQQNPDAYAEPIERLTRVLAAIPTIGVTDGMNRTLVREHPAVLHYFAGATDIFICEYDGKDEMFGFSILNGDYEMAEFGYIGLSEIRHIAVLNLDYYRDKQSVETARYKLYSHYFSKP